jgi:hypothetical protein
VANACQRALEILLDGNADDLEQAEALAAIHAARKVTSKLDEALYVATQGLLEARGAEMKLVPAPLYSAE